MNFHIPKHRHILYGLERKLFLMIASAGMVLVIILGVIIAVISGNYLYNSSIKLLDNQTRQTVNYFDNYMLTLQNAAMMLSRQRSVMTVLENSSGYDSFIAYRDAYDSLKSVHDYDHNLSTYLFATSKQYVMSSNSSNVTSDFAKYKIASTEWYQRMLNSDGNIHFISDFIAPVSGKEKEFAFVLIIRDLHDWSPIGMIVASIPKKLLETAHGESNYQFAIWEPNGRSVYLSNQLLNTVNSDELLQISRNIAIGADVPQITENENFYFSTCISQQTGWSFLSFYSNAEAKKSTQLLQGTVMLTTVVCLILLLCFAVIISRRTISPVKRLIHAMHHVEDEEFSKRIDIDGSDEIGELIETFNRLIVSVRNNQILRKRAEIDALQKQMDPHFLFNTLESIRVLSLTGDNKLVALMIEKLADVFRYNINREATPIATIAEEIQHIRNYIDIQKVRFSQRLAAEYDIDETILACTTLKFILQPIVENSIRHSMETMTDECRILISAKSDSTRIIFSIRDNGTGIEPKRLAQMKDFIFDETGTVTAPDMGIGLKNIQERLRLFYGSAYGLTLQSIEGKFTEITVTIPKV